MLEGVSAVAGKLVGDGGPVAIRGGLSDEQRRELERRAAAYSGPHSDVVRARVILYAAEGMSNTESAGRLDQSRQAVSESRKRFCQGGVHGLQERPRPGRQRRFSPGAG